jgi:hypothetical protein
MRMELGGQLLFVGQVDLVSAYLLRAQGFRRPVEVARKQRDLFHVRGLGTRGEIPHLHILDHALAKGSHGKLLCEMDLLREQPFHAFARERTCEGLEGGLELMPALG